MAFLRTLPHLAHRGGIPVQAKDLSDPSGHPGLGSVLPFLFLTLGSALAAVFLRPFLKGTACLVDAVTGGVEGGASHIPCPVADLLAAPLEPGAEGVVHGIAEGVDLPFQLILHLPPFVGAAPFLFCVVVFVHAFLIPLPGCTG